MLHWRTGMPFLYLDTVAGIQVHFEALSFSLGMLQPDVSAGRVRQSRKVASFQDLSITKRVDYFSPLLAQALNSGTVIDKALLPIAAGGYTLGTSSKTASSVR